MADKGGADRTEKPTPKRLREGRKQGQVPRSPDLAAWAGILALSYVVPAVVSGVQEAATTVLRSLPEVTSAADVDQALTLAGDAARSAGLALMPLFAVVVLTSVVAGVAQGGARPYLSRLKPKFARISPFAGLKRLFSPRSVWELVKSLLKTAVVAGLAWQLMKGLSDTVMGAGALPLGAVVGVMASTALTLVRVVAMAALVIGIGDYLVARRRVTKELMMSRKDIKDEMKQSDGDPQVKAAIRRRALALTRNRMFADIPQADVVMVNPTHVAVALRYVPGTGAPRVVAKGAGVLAARIRQLAADNRVPMVEDVPLTRALYKACEVGHEVPPQFFTSVAHVLAFVMGLRARGAQAGLHRRREAALIGA